MRKKPVPPRPSRPAEAPPAAAPQTDAAPEINIVNLSHREFAVLNVIRQTREGQLDIRIEGSDIVRVVRRQRVPLPPKPQGGES